MRILEMFTPFHSYLPSNNAFFLLLTWGKFILCVFTDSRLCGNRKLNLRFSNKKLLRSQVDFTDLYIVYDLQCTAQYFALWRVFVYVLQYSPPLCTVHCGAKFIALRTALRCKCGDRDCTPCTSPPFEYRPALKLREISLLAWKINQTIWLFLQHRTEKLIISSWKAYLLAFPLLHTVLLLAWKIDWTLTLNHFQQTAGVNQTV